MKRHLMQRLTRLVGPLCALVFIGGCAYSYVDARGTRHIVGFVKLEIAPPAEPDAIAGETVEITSIGLSVYATPLQKGIVLGYNREALMSLRQHAVIGTPDFLTIRGQPPPRAPRPSPERYLP